ncbi:uncharacterized protein I303_106327 [Kwoniella dejecticola CBS 10117]|uniref:Peptidase A1 domain-containing protein n=1 Tax=Kwoniella dejecticola CBS 10117 TaxID=1296121 RepID=A0A1A5ZV14_9TREE|nr:uncharacterized protein I303_08416 [Kwoniella dejecticola CBS 10117]OBR81645.1 hypothetical protein I303_08416 [Kwoniella dejecticola CBS 10117]
MMLPLVTLFSILLPLALSAVVPSGTTSQQTRSKVARDIPVSNATLPLRHFLSETRQPIRKRDDRIITNDYDFVLLAGITVAGAELDFVVDTGSSDFWLVASNYTCLDGSGNPTANTACRFGSSSFDPASATPISPKTFFNTGYADGEYVIGEGFIGEIEFAGVTIANQSFGVATRARWNGDGISAGLLGLGSLYGNQIYYGNSVADVSDDNRYIYNNPATNAYRQGLSGPYHTFAVNRIPFDQQHTGVQNAGSLTLGGRPGDVEVTDAVVTVGVLTWSPTAKGVQIPEEAYSALVANVSFIFDGSDSVDQRYSGLSLDSGSSGLYLPTAVFEAWKANITSTPCDGSTIPPLTFVIDGVKFPMEPVDLLAYDPASATCRLNVGDGGAAIGL